jgi:hypothetical protein
MTTDSIATEQGIGAEPRAEAELKSKNAIAVNAAKVLETTRRAWNEAVHHAPKQVSRRMPRASKKRVVARRSRWPSLIAALNYWSPKPL